MLNPTSLRLLQAMPLPNRTSPTSDGQRNFFYAGSEYSETQQVIARFDHQVNPNHRITFRFTQDWTLVTPPNPYRDTIPQAWSGVPTRQFNPSGALMYVWTISPRDLLELRANVTRINLQKLPEGGFNTDLNALGFASNMVATARYSDYPTIGGGTNYSSIGHNSFDLRNNHSTNWSTNGSYTKVMNRLTMKIGGEYRIYLNNFSQPNIPSFAFAPVTSFTTRCSGNGCPTVPGNDSQGSALASYLIGVMDGAADTSSGQYATGDFPIALSAKYAAAYIQNDWQATEKLTLNLGARWDYGGSLRERYDRLSQFDPNATNITGTRGQYTFLNMDGYGPGRKDDSFKDFAPRIGFAYRAAQDTVLRGAYGISYDPVTGTGSGILGFGADGFRALSFLRIRPATGAFALLDVLDRPYSDAFAGGGTPIGKNPRDPGYLGYNAIAVIRKEGGDPYMQQWNLTLEQKLPGKIDLQTSYVGTKGTHLLVNFTEINGTNSLNPALLAQWRETYIATSANPANVRVANPFYVAPPGKPLIGSGNPNVAGPTITQLQLNRPFPAFPSVREGYSRYGSSSYNGLQVSARRAYSNGVEVGGYYVWSKMIDTTVDNSQGAGNTAGPSNGSFSLYNMRLDRSVSQFDVPSRGVIYTVLESPFGKNHYFLRTSRIAEIALAGWRLSTNTQFQSGLPLGIGSNGGFGRPDLVDNPVLDKAYRCVGPKSCALPGGSTITVPAGRMLYFNPQAYRNRVVRFGATAGANAGRFGEDVYWYGTAPRLSSSLRGWGLNNTDIALSRQVPLSETVSFNLRMDAVNIFNRA
ncbi:MAG: TonB-dependent receptor, partial [Terriglobus sp.]